MKKVAAVLLVVLAILSVVAAVIYLTHTAGDLPHFFLGYIKGSTHKHLKHAVLFIALAIAFLLGAWMLSGDASQDSGNTQPKSGE